MTGEQLAFDCDPTWTDPQPTDHTPTPIDVRVAEMWDLRNQGVRPRALWTATTIHAPEYL